MWQIHDSSKVTAVSVKYCGLYSGPVKHNQNQDCMSHRKLTNTVSFSGLGWSSQYPEVFTLFWGVVLKNKAIWMRVNDSAISCAWKVNLHRKTFLVFCFLATSVSPKPQRGMNELENASETCTTRGKKVQHEQEFFLSLGVRPRLKCDSLTSWKRIFTYSSSGRACYDEICLVAYLACSLPKLLTCQDPGMASIVRAHLSNVRTIGNRWAFNCIFVQIAK